MKLEPQHLVLCTQVTSMKCFLKEDYFDYEEEWDSLFYDDEKY